MVRLPFPFSFPLHLRFLSLAVLVRFHVVIRVVHVRILLLLLGRFSWGFPGIGPRLGDEFFLCLFRFLLHVNLLSLPLHAAVLLLKELDVPDLQCEGGGTSACEYIVMLKDCC